MLNVKEHISKNPSRIELQVTRCFLCNREMRKEQRLTCWNLTVCKECYMESFRIVLETQFSQLITDKEISQRQLIMDYCPDCRENTAFEFKPNSSCYALCLNCGCKKEIRQTALV